MKGVHFINFSCIFWFSVDKVLLIIILSEQMLEDERLHQYEEEGPEVQGQSGCEVAKQAVVGQEDEGDQSQEVEQAPTRPTED